MKCEFWPCQFSLVKERLPWWRLALHRKVIYHLQTNISRQITAIHGRETQRTICGLLQAIFGCICSGTICAVRKRRPNEPLSKQNHLDLDCLGLTKAFQAAPHQCQRTKCALFQRLEKVNTSELNQSPWVVVATKRQSVVGNLMSYCFTAW